MPASVPELTRRTMSMLGMRARIFSASTTSRARWGAEAEAFEHGGLHGQTTSGVTVARIIGAPAADVVGELLIVLRVPK